MNDPRSLLRPVGPVGVDPGLRFSGPRGRARAVLTPVFLFTPGPTRWKLSVSRAVVDGDDVTGPGEGDFGFTEIDLRGPTLAAAGVVGGTFPTVN